MRYVLAAAALACSARRRWHFRRPPSVPARRRRRPPRSSFPRLTIDPTKGLNLTTPELHLGQTPGTEVRIPGIGTVGVLPKLDFGLEILHGANEQKGPLQDKTNPDDVQLRGTIKYRF